MNRRLMTVSSLLWISILSNSIFAEDLQLLVVDSVAGRVQIFDISTSKDESPMSVQANSDASAKMLLQIKLNWSALKAATDGSPVPLLTKTVELSDSDKSEIRRTVRQNNGPDTKDMKQLQQDQIERESARRLKASNFVPGSAELVLVEREILTKDDTIILTKRQPSEKIGYTLRMNAEAILASHSQIQLQIKDPKIQPILDQLVLLNSDIDTLTKKANSIQDEWKSIDIIKRGLSQEANSPGSGMNAQKAEQIKRELDNRKSDLADQLIRVKDEINAKTAARDALKATLPTTQSTTTPSSK